MSVPARAPSRRPSPRPTPRPTSNRSTANRSTAPSLRREERAQPQRRRPNLEVVPSVQSRNWRLRLLGGVAGVLLFGALLGLAVFHSVLVQGQLGLDRMEQQIEQEETLQRGLRKQVAELASPARIQAEAQARGMVLPNERTYVQAVDGGQVPPPEQPR